jgi:nucleotide-binding universal stress UspA family protein
MARTPPRILLCYDGSPEATHAIAEAGRMLRGGRATVLYAWQSAADTLAHFGVAPTYVPPGEYERDREHAREVAKEGTRLAADAGFDADARIVESAASTWAAILYAADELDVDLVVMGARGLTGVRSMLLGSVSHHVVNLTGRSTLVVPSEKVAEDRGTAGFSELRVQLEAVES